MSGNTFNSKVINTTPGACEGNPFSPPEGFGGGEEEYLQLLRDRYLENPFAQRMMVIARQYHHPEAATMTKISGPFRFAAWEVLNKLRYNQAYKQAA